MKPVAIVTPTNTPAKHDINICDRNKVNLNPILRHINFDDAPAPEVSTIMPDNDSSSAQESSSDDSDYVPPSTDSLEDNLSPEEFLESGNECENEKDERTESYSLKSKKHSQAKENVVGKKEECTLGMVEHRASEVQTMVLDRNSEEEAKEKQRTSSVQIEPCSSKEITVKIVQRKADGQIKRNKGHSCLFCHKVMVNLPRHFERVHGEEMEVAKILAIDKLAENNKKSKSPRRDSFVNLARVGDYYHNCEVIAKERGELILTRRPGPDKDFQYKNYTPCPDCLGFMHKRYLWSHSLNCNTKVSKNKDYPADQPGRKVLAESRALLMGTLERELPKPFVEHILANLRDDEISHEIKKDELILQFGLLKFDKFGLTQKELIRQSMRQLGRLRCDLNEMNGTTTNKLGEWLHPTKFDLIINSVQNVSQHEESANNYNRPSFKTPSLALKLGHSIRKCIGIERGKALRKNNIDRDNELKNLLAIFDLEWKERISSNAISTLNTRTFNKPKSLPITADLVKLNEYIISETNKIKNSPQKNWKRLAELTLCKVVLFNKRRSGEAAKLKVANFNDRTQRNTVNEEMAKSLSDLERRLASTLELVDIRGKRGRRVPIILTPDITENIQLLIENRKEMCILPENEYVFAIPNSFNSIRGHDCLKKFCIAANLKEPSLITSTNLRKYVATVIQMFNLTENETDWVARHLGHDIHVHRDFYRSHEGIIETTKVSKILLALEKGNASRFHGKRLAEIDVESKYNK